MAKVRVPLFNFQLREIDAIAPFGRDHQALHWFGLTDGWYWLNVAGIELLRYSDELIATAKPWCNDPAELPYANYYVARLWEDLLDKLPSILDPVPPRLTERMEPERWQAWLNDHDDAASVDTYVQATEWWYSRQLPTGYLRYGPGIWMWTVGSTLYIRWDSRRERDDGRPIWAGGEGEVMLPVSVFLDELRSFDARFIRMMRERVEQVQRGGSRKDVEIDLNRLVREQADRATWLEQSLARTRSDGTTRDEWDRVLQAVEYIEAIIDKHNG